MIQGEANLVYIAYAEFNTGIKTFDAIGWSKLCTPILTSCV